VADSPDFRTLEGRLPRSGRLLNLSPREAFEQLEHGAVLVDLREAYETDFRRFDVVEVLNLPMIDFRVDCSSLPRDRALVLADAAGIYGREAAELLFAAGYENIANLVGGILDWERDGLPLCKDIAFELNGQCACKIKTRARREGLA